MAVAILDDVATTGGSTIRAVEAVEAMGCRVALVIAVLDRLEGAADEFRSRGLEFRSLVTIRDLGVEPLPPEHRTVPVEPFHPDQVNPLPPLQGP